MENNSKYWEKFDEAMYWIAQAVAIGYMFMFISTALAFDMLWIFLIIGLIPAVIAVVKDRSFFIWWAYGSSLCLIALIHVIIIGRADEKKCEACAEKIKKDAKICKHCKTLCNEQRQLKADV